MKQRQVWCFGSLEMVHGHSKGPVAKLCRMHPNEMDIPQFASYCSSVGRSAVETDSGAVPSMGTGSSAELEGSRGVLGLGYFIVGGRGEDIFQEGHGLS